MRTLKFLLEIAAMFYVVNRGGRERGEGFGGQTHEWTMPDHVLQQNLEPQPCGPSQNSKTVALISVPAAKAGLTGQSRICSVASTRGAVLRGDASGSPHAASLRARLAVPLCHTSPP